MVSLFRRLGNKKQQAPKPPCVHRSHALGITQERDTTGSESSEPHKSQDGPFGAASAAADGQVADRVPDPVDEGECVACQEERRALRKYRLKIIFGLIVPFALQNLDVTIIASALPFIAGDFDQISQLNWIISAFNLTSAAFIPFWGQMADVFGRHAAIQSCVLIMMIGSALCTAAPTNAFPVLLLGRGIQGLGCAGISVIVRIILADKVSLKENAKNWSIFSLAAGVSYALGPVVGGYLTDSKWRWCFGINLPICAAAVLVIFLVLRSELLGPQTVPGLVGGGGGDGDGGRHPERHRGHPSGLARFSARLTTVDVGGQALFLFGFGLIILAFTWAGGTYDWNTVAVLLPLFVGAVLVGLFVYWEKLMAPGEALGRRWPRQHPMLPWKLIVSKDIGLLAYINFATGAAMYAVLYFCSLYFTWVKFYSASKSGVQLLYYTPGIGVGVWLSIYLCNGYPRKTFVPLMLGSVVEAVGVGVLAWALYHEHDPTVFGMMALTGAGTGLRFMPGPLHAIGFFPRDIATVVSLMAVTIPFGGTLALTIMNTVFNNTFGIDKDSPLHDFERLRYMDDAVKKEVAEKAKMGIVWAFVAIVPFMVLCIVAAAFLGNVNITHETKEGGESDHNEHVYRGVYLLHLLRRRRARSGAAQPEEEAGNLSVENLGVNEATTKRGESHELSRMA